MSTNTTHKKQLLTTALSSLLPGYNLSASEIAAMTNRKSTATESRSKTGRVPRRASAPTVIYADFGDISPGSSLSDVSAIDDDDNTLYYYYRPTTRHEAPKFVRRKSSSANYLEEEVVVLPSQREKDVPREKKNDKEDNQISLLQQMLFESEELNRQGDQPSSIPGHKVDGKTKKTRRRSSSGLERNTHTYDSSRLEEEPLVFERKQHKGERRSVSTLMTESIHSDDDSSELDEDQLLLLALAKKMEDKKPQRRKTNGLDKSTHTYDSTRLKSHLEEMDSAYSRRKSNGSSYARRRSTGIDGSSRTEETRKSVSSYSRRRSTGMSESSHSRKSSGLDVNNRTHDSSRLEEELLVLEKLEEERVQKLLEQMDTERKKKDKKQMRRSSFSETLSTIFPKDKGQRPKSYKDPVKLESLPRIKSSF